MLYIFLIVNCYAIGSLLTAAVNRTITDIKPCLWYIMSAWHRTFILKVFIDNLTNGKIKVPLHTKLVCPNHSLVIFLFLKKVN